MKLLDRADGVKGHYCIGRKMEPKSIYWEFYNKGKWCSAGDVFVGKDMAKKKMMELRKAK
jgi:hypothetical protein